MNNVETADMDIHGHRIQNMRTCQHQLHPIAEGRIPRNSSPSYVKVRSLLVTLSNSVDHSSENTSDFELADTTAFEFFFSLVAGKHAKYHSITPLSFAAIAQLEQSSIRFHKLLGLVGVHKAQAELRCSLEDEILIECIR